MLAGRNSHTTRIEGVDGVYSRVITLADRSLNTDPPGCADVELYQSLARSVYPHEAGSDLPEPAGLLPEARGAVVPTILHTA